MGRDRSPSVWTRPRNEQVLHYSALLPQPRDEAPEVASGELQGCGVDLVVDHPEAKGRFIHGGSGSKETMKAALLQMQQGCM